MKDVPVDKIPNAAERFCKEEDGATVVEYVLMLILIAVICVTAVASIGNLTNVFFGVANTL